MYDTSFIIGEDNIDKVCNDICNLFILFKKF